MTSKRKIDSNDITTIKKMVNQNTIKLLLINFLRKHEITSLDELVDPLKLQSLPIEVPSISTKIEVIPHASDLNHQLGQVTLQWNVFVLGNFRMDIGETKHTIQGLMYDLRTKQISAGSLLSFRNGVTVRRLLAFIMRIIDKHDVHVDITANNQLIDLDQKFGQSAASYIVPNNNMGR